MANNPGDMTPSSGGFFRNFSDRIRLILKLMGDNRVNPLVKLLPFSALLYLFIPDLAPGPVDDAMILWLGTTVFVELCPPEVVQEHQDEISKVLYGEWRDSDSEEVIDADARDID